MNTHEFSGLDDLGSFVKGWMSSRWSNVDMALLRWMRGARVGEFYHHRLGVVIRLRAV